MLLSFEELIHVRKSLNNVVLAGGVFDIVHSGHIKHLLEAKSKGNVLIVHVTSDKRVKEKKGQLRPIVAELDRASIIANIGCVDYVFIEDVPHYNQKIVEAIQPDVLFFNQEAYNDDVVSYVQGLVPQPNIYVSDLPHNKSTTQIIERIKAI